MALSNPPAGAGASGSSALETPRLVEAAGIKTDSMASDRENAARSSFLQTFRECPIRESELLGNLGLFLNRQTLSRILFMHELYQRILSVHGVVMEFGVRWGQNLALFETLRGIYEPYNYTRKIIGFDTFEGFPSVHAKDGAGAIMERGAYGVSEGYETYLSRVLDYHEQESPLAHLRKYELVKGDASLSIGKYLTDNSETIVALAYFDFDIYEPTKKCLEAIKDRLTKGSVVGFDELNNHRFPGETLAVMEVLGLSKYRIQRIPSNPAPSFIVIE